jgi:hypothetical protein
MVIEAILTMLTGLAVMAFVAVLTVLHLANEAF